MWKTLYLFAFSISFVTCVVFEVEKECKIGGMTTCVNLDYSNADKIVFNSTKVHFETTTFSIYRSKIPVIPKKLFKFFPNLENCGLDGMHLEKIKKGNFANAKKLENLILSVNKIKTIPENVFINAPNIKFLELKNNQISDLHKDAFYGLSKLKTLIISENQIRELPAGIFDELSSLETLDLSQNKLKTLEDRLFVNNKHLSTIKLNKNRITDIGKNVFPPLEKLRLLELYQNSIKELHLNSVSILMARESGLEKLVIHGSVHYLDANTNILKEFKIGNVSEIFSITIGCTADVDLAFLENAQNLIHVNFIGGAPNLNNPSIFKGMSNVKHLKIINADLKEIPRNCFDYLKSIEELEITDNPMTTFDVNELLKFPFLKRLSMKSNQIVEFDYKRLFNNAMNLKAVDFRGNRFKCSYLAELLKNLKAKKIQHFFSTESESVLTDFNEFDIGCVE